MGLLDDLKRQAQELQDREQALATEAKRNSAAVDIALRRAYRYLSDLAKQLNVLRPETTRSFDLPRIGRFSGLRVEEFFTDYRSRNTFGSEQFDLVYLKFEHKTGEALHCACEYEDNIRVFERQLDSLGLSYRAEYLKHDNRLVRRAEFIIEPMVRSRVILKGNHQAGAIEIALLNTASWGKRGFSLQATSLTDSFLEELAKHVLGRSSALDAAEISTSGQGGAKTLPY